MIQTSRKTPKKLSVNEEISNLNQISSQLLMSDAKQKVGLLGHDQLLANLLLEIATIKNDQSQKIV